MNGFDTEVLYQVWDVAHAFRLIARDRDPLENVSIAQQTPQLLADGRMMSSRARFRSSICSTPPSRKSSP
jgi:hypothetical protein